MNDVINPGHQPGVGRVMVYGRVALFLVRDGYAVEKLIPSKVNFHLGSCRQTVRIWARVKGGSGGGSACLSGAIGNDHGLVSFIVVGFDGTPERDRTADLRFRKPADQIPKSFSDKQLTKSENPDFDGSLSNLLGMDENLELLIRSWPNLPHPIKAGICALVKEFLADAEVVTSDDSSSPYIDNIEGGKDE